MLPRNERIDFELSDDCAHFIGRYVENFSTLLRVLFPIRLRLFEYGTWIFTFTARPFTAPERDEQDRYLTGWTESRFFIKARVDQGDSFDRPDGLLLRPASRGKAIGYEHDAWIAEAHRRRWSSCAEDIHAREIAAHGAETIESMEQARKAKDWNIPAKHIEPLTVQIMGTALMNSAPRQGMVDDRGQVHGYEFLFLADASVFPGPVGVNPMKTIMAFSTRTARRINERRGEFLAGKVA